MSFCCKISCVDGSCQASHVVSSDSRIQMATDDTIEPKVSVGKTMGTANSIISWHGMYIIYSRAGQVQQYNISCMSMINTS